MQGYIIPNLGKANSRACTFDAARVMEKCGFTYSHEENRFTPMKNTSVRVKVYTQTAEEYKMRINR